jgi:predicted MFS family arabinose efflux permease
MGLGATIVMGLFMDRIRRPQVVLAALFLLQCIGYLLLIRLSGSFLPALYTVVSGLSNVTVIYTIGVLRPYLFGREHIGAVSGALSVITLVGSALGPLPYGAAYDRFGGYSEILWVSAALPAVAAALALLIRRPVVGRH